MEELLEQYTKEAKRLRAIIDERSKTKSETLKDFYIEGFARGQLSIYEKLIFKLKKV